MPHEYADHVMPLLNQQVRGDAAIDSPRHCQDYTGHEDCFQRVPRTKGCILRSRAADPQPNHGMTKYPMANDEGKWYPFVHPSIAVRHFARPLSAVSRKLDSAVYEFRNQATCSSRVECPILL